MQIGHNVVMGRGCLLCGHVALGGSSTLGDYVVMGGKSAVADHVSVCSKVRARDLTLLSVTYTVGTPGYLQGGGV